MAVLDACVLYPAALRDTLLRAAVEQLYDPKWSGDILEEVRRNFVEAGNLSEEQARGPIAAMERVFPEARVDGYRPLVPAMGNDPKDRHVLATAVVAGAQLIVTSNLRHFPHDALEPYGVRARSPDDFLSDLLAREPDVMIDILREQAADLRQPPKSVADVLAEIARVAPRFAASIATAGF